MWLWLTHKMENFAVELEQNGAQIHYADVSQLLAVRIRDFVVVLR
jgi:hypothetical protein